MDAIMNQMIQKMLREERDAAQAAEHEAAAQRLAQARNEAEARQRQEQAQAMQRNFEEQRRREAAAAEQKRQEDHMMQLASMQAQRQGEWYKAPVGGSSPDVPLNGATRWKWFN